MAINRNEYSFGPLLTIISILVIAFLIAFTVHKTVPVASADEEYMECSQDACGHECGCDHDDEEYEDEAYEDEDVD